MTSLAGPAAPVSGSAFGGPASGRRTRAQGAAGAAGAHDHAIFSFGGRPVHGLLYVLFHAEPLLVTDGDSAAAPFVVVDALGRIAESLLSLLI